jgi:hypothetical protein
VLLKQKEFDDTNGVIRIRTSKKDRQHNSQKKKDKRTNNDLQNITHKTDDRVTRTHWEPGMKSGGLEG